MIGDLARGHVRWLVRDGSFARFHEPNGSNRGSGVRLLDDWMTVTSARSRSPGRSRVWLRDGIAAPPPAPADPCLPRPPAG